MHFFKSYWTPLIALSFLGIISDFTPVYGHSSRINQVKDKWITVEILKYGDGALQALIDELNSHEGKISSATFNAETRRLTVYYTDAVSYDDILQIVGRYFNNFSKIGGTEL